MKLRRLNIERMPGFESGGFELTEIGPRLNVVVGPNASGKTTLCKAIRGLLWPEQLRNHRPVALVGLWDADGRTLRIELQGGRWSCQIDGEPAEGIDLPGPQLAGCFTVTAETLMRAENASDLAGEILREMAGGYDVSALLEMDRFKSVSAHAAGKAVARWRSARQEVERIRGEQEDLRRCEDELVRLREKEAQAAEASRRLDRLEDVRELLEVRAQLAQAERSLDDLPAGMDLLTGDEGERLGHVRSDLSEARQQHDAASENLAEARRQQVEAGLGEEGVDAATVDELKTSVEALRNAQQEVERIDGSIADQRVKAERALARLGAEADADKLDHLDLQGLGEIETLHHQGQKLVQRRMELEARLRKLEPPSAAADPEQLREAISALRQWLSADEPRAVLAGRYELAQLLLTGGLVIVSLVLAVVRGPLWLVPLGVGCAGLALGLLTSKRKDGGDEREAARRRFDRLEADPPPAWSCEDVAGHLDALARRLVEAREAQARQQQRRETEADLEQVAAEEEAFQQRRSSLCEKLGLPTEGSDLGLVTFARDLTACREARDQLSGLEARHRQQQGRVGDLLDKINHLLARFDQHQATDYSSAHALSEDLERRVGQFREARTKAQQAQAAMDTAGRRMEELSARKREIFEKLGLAEDDDATLSNRLDRMTEYRELEKRLTELRARESGLVSRLADVPELRDLDREALEAQAQELTRQAQGKDELTDRIAEIRARVDAAQRKRDLEEALASRDQARDELGRCGDQAVEAAAGQFLVESLRGEQQSEHQPAVLQRAGDWFGRFTRGRYDLRVSGGASDSGEFRAIDNTHQRGLGLEELSGGTRMQLLLAVRLAFAAEAEKDLKLPLVLDEALSTTDPVRFRAVIECLTVLMGQGRQVFYLTCQPGDAAAWEQVVGDQGLGDAKVFDLARVRALQQPAGQLLSRSAAMAETIPAPAGRSLDQYASDLHVPALDPAQGAAGLHVAHVVDDAESLHRLLQAGIERYGQLEALISRRRVDAYLPAEAQARALARGSVIGAVCEAWKIGRGRPVTREALEEAGVSERFIDRVADLARELEGDAQRLVAALEAREDDRAKGFRSAALSEVCENLEAEGYLDSRQPLASEAALTRVLTAVNADVKAGAITVEQVRVLFQRFWSAATGE